MGRESSNIPRSEPKVLGGYLRLLRDKCVECGGCTTRVLKRNTGVAGTLELPIPVRLVSFDLSQLRLKRIIFPHQCKGGFGRLSVISVSLTLC